MIIAEFGNKKCLNKAFDGWSPFLRNSMNMHRKKYHMDFSKEHTNIYAGDRIRHVIWCYWHRLHHIVVALFKWIWIKLNKVCSVWIPESSWLWFSAYIFRENYGCLPFSGVFHQRHQHHRNHHRRYHCGRHHHRRHISNSFLSSISLIFSFPINFYKFDNCKANTWKGVGW